MLTPDSGTSCGLAVRCLIVAVIAGYPAASAEAAQLATGESMGIPWLRLLTGLVLCTMVALLAAVAMRRSMHRKGGFQTLLAGVVRPHTSLTRPRIRVIETRRLSLKADICLFEFDGREYLVAIGDGQLLALDPRHSVGPSPLRDPETGG